MWVSLELMIALPPFYSWNGWYMHIECGNELNQATDTVINGVTGILVVEEMAAWVLLVFATFAYFYIGEEFQDGTIRNILSLGRNRMIYYVSRLLATLLITTLSVVLATRLAMTAYAFTFGFGEAEGIKSYGNHVLKVFPVLLLLMLAILSAPITLIFITRSASVSLLPSFLYIMGMALVPGVFVETKGLEFLTEWFAETWSMHTDFAQQTTYSQASKMILVSLVTTVVSSALGTFIFQRSDTKQAFLLKTILVIEDDETVHSLLEEVLEQKYKLPGAYSGAEGRSLLSTYSVDLVLLDLMFPGSPGETLLTETRQTSNVPIIVLSAKSDQGGKVPLLVAGADDYVTKSFDIEELLLRTGAQLRHQTSVQVKDLLQCTYYREILLDKELRDISMNGVAVHLTGGEFDLLKLFLEHPKKVFSRANLYETAWQEPYFDSEKAVSMHTSNLQGKLAKAHAVYIHTVWGVGFRFDQVVTASRCYLYGKFYPLPVKGSQEIN